MGAQDAADGMLDDRSHWQSTLPANGPCTSPHSALVPKSARKCFASNSNCRCVGQNEMSCLMR
eukprot:4363590-Amphidinium_carterae.1